MDKQEIDTINKQLLGDLEEKGYGSGFVTIDTKVMPNGVKYIEIRLLANEKILYKWYEKPEKTKPKRGGKKSYVRVLNKWLIESKIRYDLLGAGLKLTPYAEYGTVKLINKRNKKPLQSKDLFDIWQVQQRTGERIIKELKESNLMFTKNKEYYFNFREMLGTGGDNDGY